MNLWLVVGIAFFIGELVGLLAYALVSIAREDAHSKPTKWWEDTHVKKEE